VTTVILNALLEQLLLRLTPKCMGELHITGVAYHLGPGSPATTPVAPSTPSAPLQTESTASSFLQSIAVKGKVNLEVQGPRLNNTKEEKMSKMYGPDRRLDLLIISQMPLLQVCFIPLSSDSTEFRFSFLFSAGGNGQCSVTNTLWPSATNHCCI
jgi:hypothetical protein